MKAVVYPHSYEKMPFNVGVHEGIKYLRTHISKSWRHEETFILGMTVGNKQYEVKHKFGHSSYSRSVSKAFGVVEFERKDGFGSRSDIDVFLNITKKQFEDVKNNKKQ